MPTLGFGQRGAVTCWRRTCAGRRSSSAMASGGHVMTCSNREEAERQAPPPRCSRSSGAWLPSLRRPRRGRLRLRALLGTRADARSCTDELLHLSCSSRWSFVLRRDRFCGPSGPGRLPARGAERPVHNRPRCVSSRASTVPQAQRWARCGRGFRSCRLAHCAAIGVDGRVAP